MTGSGGARRQAMPYTLPLWATEVNNARCTSCSNQDVYTIYGVDCVLSLLPTLIISIQLGWVGAGRDAAFLVAADLAVLVFFAADIAPSSAR